MWLNGHCLWPICGTVVGSWLIWYCLNWTSACVWLLQVRIDCSSNQLRRSASTSWLICVSYLLWPR